MFKWHFCINQWRKHVMCYILWLTPLLFFRRWIFPGDITFAPCLYVFLRLRRSNWGNGAEMMVHSWGGMKVTQTSALRCFVIKYSDWLRLMCDNAVDFFHKKMITQLHGQSERQPVGLYHYSKYANSMMKRIPWIVCVRASTQPTHPQDNTKL